MLGLRTQPYDRVIVALTELSGVGPKVAACVALFSCDKHAAIPVDTHVWKLACKHYLPSVKAKTLSPKLHPLIMQARPAPHACSPSSAPRLTQWIPDRARVQAFVNVFGEYAGWAHNALFISELAAHKHLFASKGASPATSSDAASDDAASTASDKAWAPSTPPGERRGSSSVSETSALPLAVTAAAAPQQGTPTSASRKWRGGAAGGARAAVGRGGKALPQRVAASSRSQPMRKARRIAPQQPSEGDGE